MGERPKISNPAARRLSLYLRELEARKDAKLVSINSSQLGEALGLTGAQARKDFATFGTFGTFGRPVLNTPLNRYVNNYRFC